MRATARALRARSGSRRAIRASIVSLGLVTALAAPFAGTAAAQPTPDLVAGNPSCPAGTIEFKVENGTEFPLRDYDENVTVDGLSGNFFLDLRTVAQGQVFDFNLDGELAAAQVIVKGGPNANVYTFEPPTTALETGLHAPNRTANRYYGISHISFCIVEAPQVGALRIRKTSTKVLEDGITHPLVANAGATFTADGPGTNDITVVDNGANDADGRIGEVCVLGQPTGTYTVTENAPPTGYGAGEAIDNTATVSAGTNCSGGGLPSVANAAEFRNPPLGDFEVTATGRSSEIQNTIVCVDEAGTEIANSGPADTNVGTGAGPLEPGTYTCTIVIDP